MIPVIYIAGVLEWVIQLSIKNRNADNRKQSQDSETMLSRFDEVS
jgi:hypothetical protein